MWQRFRAWRRSRPFWGGVLTILAGLEIIGSMNLELHGGSISIGERGFSAYLIAFVLIITGPLAWFMPAQRHFYGLVATFVAIYSLIGVNLGGFFVGMLLGVVGGGLIFAWTPAKPETVPDEDELSEVDDLDDGTSVLPVTSVRDGVPQQRQSFDDQEFHPKDPGPRHAAMTFIAVAMSASVLAVVVAGGQAGASAASCGESNQPAASPSPSPSGGSQGPVETIVDGIVDFFDRLLGGGSNGGTPSPTSSPTASPSPTTSPTPCPSPTASGTPNPPPSGTPSPRPSGSVDPTASPAPTPSKDPVKVLKAAVDQPLVAKRPSRMTGTKSIMLNLVYRGVVDVPTHGGGTIRSLWFTMSQSSTDDFLLHVYGEQVKEGEVRWDAELPSSRLTVTAAGDRLVHFYTNRFRGKLIGIPVDFTPEHPPPPFPLPIVIFTDVDIQLVWVRAPELEAPNLRITLVPVKT